MGVVLGQYIKSKRKEIKLSAQALSKKADISKSYLDYIESGSREPRPDVLAKLAASLDIQLDVLLDRQVQDQLRSATSKLSAGSATAVDGDILAVARNADKDMSVDERALAMTQAAFHGKSDDARVAEYIGNPDLRAILKAGAKLSDEDLQKIRKIMESLYPDEFL